LTTALWLVVLAAGIVAYGARFVPEKPRENRSLPS
jgi:branched-subunit amino acid transport protein